MNKDIEENDATTNPTIKINGLIKGFGEFGEYFLEDLSSYYFPIPTNDLTKAFEINDTLKIQGRIKLCTRSIIFEPIDLRQPIVRFPFKSISSPLQIFNLKESETRQLSIDVSGFFTFLCVAYFEMKANDKIGPYKSIEYIPASFDTLKGFRIVFSLVHSDLNNFLTKVEQLRHIFNVSEKQGSGVGLQLLKPLIENALTTNFDASHLVDFHEKLLLHSPISVKKVKPLIINPGSLMITNVRVYFQPSQLNNIGDAVQHFELRKVGRIFKRRYLLRQTGLELINIDGSSSLFAFSLKSARDEVYELLSSQISATKTIPTLEETTKKWQRKELTNFEYLMHLNNEADRTSNDLTQYPVFPHVIVDYVSKKLNFDAPETFRDLSKPIGALNSDRLKYFKERFCSMPDADVNTGTPPPFLYGTHYSTPGYVLYYLVRVAPEYMLCLQNGKFDAADRMFHSIQANWESCLNNPADLKESIPEFYCGNGEFLLNLDDLDLGFRHTGGKLNDVELPPWADSPRDFIRKNAKALESQYVSEHLHEWIDLIFGFKQKGEEAEKANNLFYYLTYEGSVDLEQVTDEHERNALEIQIQEFGQTPKQLFVKPHPRRKDFSAQRSSSSNERFLKPFKEEIDEGAPVLSHKFSTRKNDFSSSLIDIESKNENKTNKNVVSDTIELNGKKITSKQNNERQNSVEEKSDGSTSFGIETSTLGTAHMCATTNINNSSNTIKINSDINDSIEQHQILRKNQASSTILLNSNLNSNTGLVVNNNTSTTVNNNFMSNLGIWTEKTASFFDKTFGSTFAQQHKSVSNDYTNKNLDFQKEHQNGSEQRNMVDNLNDAENCCRIEKKTPLRGASFSETKPNENKNLNNTNESNLSNSAVDLNSLKTKQNVLENNSFLFSNKVLTMQPSKTFVWHNQPVTGVAISLYYEDVSDSEDDVENALNGFENRSFTNGSTSPVNKKLVSKVHASSLLGLKTEMPRKILSALVASVSKDSFLQISKVDYCYCIDGSISSKDSFVAVAKEKFSFSNKPLTACCFLHENKNSLNDDTVFLSSSDKNFYGYSIENKDAFLKRSHSESVSCLSVNESNDWLLSGSTDCLVKLWGVSSAVNTGSSLMSSLSNLALSRLNHPQQKKLSGSHVVTQSPIAVFRGHDSAVTCVAIDATSTYAAAGAMNGKVALWHVHSQSLQFTCFVSKYNRSITSMKWMPPRSCKFLLYSLKGFSVDKLVCASSDGKIVCMDSAGRLFCSVSILDGVFVKCLDVDCRCLIYTGCSDGSVRVWTIGVGVANERSNVLIGEMKEVFKYSLAHNGPVNCIATLLSKEKNYKEEDINSSDLKGPSANGDDTENVVDDVQQHAATFVVSGGEDCVVRVWKIMWS